MSQTYDFITVTEIARDLRVSKMTVYRLINSGVLPAVQIGRNFRVPRSSFEEYLKDSKVEPGSFNPENPEEL